ncbi:Uncharacterised protein [Mycobacteroides abscessus subsp. abscessus]|nr:Uncharacterised protein [Mycobacteroides abscessus subsp. abscessus]
MRGGLVYQRGGLYETALRTLPGNRVVGHRGVTECRDGVSARGMADTVAHQLRHRAGDP